MKAEAHQYHLLLVGKFWQGNSGRASKQEAGAALFDSSSGSDWGKEKGQFTVNDGALTFSRSFELQQRESNRAWSRPLHDAVEPDAETPELLRSGLNETRLCVESGVRDILGWQAVPVRGT